MDPICAGIPARYVSLARRNKLHEVPKKWKTAELCELALRNGAGLHEVPAEIKTPQFCMKAYRIDNAHINGFPEELMTKELILETALASEHSLKNLSPSLVSFGVCFEAVRKYGLEAFECVPGGTRSPMLRILAETVSARRDGWRCDKAKALESIANIALAALGHGLDLDPGVDE